VAGRELLVATVRGERDLERAVWFFGSDAEQRLPRPTLIDSAGRWRAACVIREFWTEADADAGPASVEQASADRDAWRTLLPGDEVSVLDGRTWWSANHFRAVDASET
jgi:hypothetical protein